MDHREKDLKLFLAIEELFLTNGHVSLGINRVAKKSGLDKSYIYRKYGSFESLLEKYFKQKDFWSTKVDQMSQAIIPDSPFTFKQIIDFLELGAEKIYSENGWKSFLYPLIKIWPA